MAKKIYGENLKLRCSNDQLQTNKKTHEDEIKRLKQEVAKKDSLLAILSRDPSQDDVIDFQRLEVADTWDDIEDNDDMPFYSTEE